MPPKKSSENGEAPIGLTEGELRFVKAVFDNMTTRPDADWTAVAGDIGLKDAKCAKERFRQMSVRHGWRNDGGNASPMATKRKPARKTTTATTTTTGAGVGKAKAKTTGAAAARGRKKAAKKESSDEEDEDEEDEEGSVKVEDEIKVEDKDSIEDESEA